MSEHKVPDRIYLQYYGVNKNELDGVDLCADQGEVTWCEDVIYDTDVEYVRADLVEAAE